ncbi:hypothetical protein CLERM_463 [Coxiella-like endosymbiont]|nr:hypothetical protein CLERM_202 [Coxiella-like endosymbiont]PMB54544.1 hypothetical protein CLERM_463 [Coxiella-like endosymbiont]
MRIAKLIQCASLREELSGFLENLLEEITVVIPNNKLKFI